MPIITVENSVFRGNNCYLAKNNKLIIKNSLIKLRGNDNCELAQNPFMGTKIPE